MQRSHVLSCSTFSLALLLVPAVHAAELTQNRDPESGLLAWKKVDRGFSLELIQLLPEYVAALYSSRNLPPAVVDSMRGYCVFGSVAQNRSGGTLDYQVADWRAVTPDGTQHRLKTKPEWIAEWKAFGSDFGWSILPAAASFDASDWAQGFTTIQLPPGSHFDLLYSWKHHGKHYRGKMENLVCAPDKPPLAP
ncbi:hypothetical protein [Thiobacillus sp.]|uniref:hypothetical protein n=1 Tax=Thiobacillus sp. TaxID=924 RepID=UPI00286EA489|nr:hypothetical protein [Thiobacillus sp.]